MLVRGEGRNESFGLTLCYVILFPDLNQGHTKYVFMFIVNKTFAEDFGSCCLFINDLCLGTVKQRNQRMSV